jgi:hypothetical protein
MPPARSAAFALLLAVAALPALAQQPQTPAKPFVSRVWVADNGDGTYKNPILYADYDYLRFDR